MKTKMLFSIGLLLITCNSYAQAPAKTLLTSEEVCALIDRDQTWNKTLQLTRASKELIDKYEKNAPDYGYREFELKFENLTRGFDGINGKIWDDICMCDSFKHRVRPAAQLLVTCGEELYKNGKLLFSGSDRDGKREQISKKIKELELCAKDESQCDYIIRSIGDFTYPFALHLPNGAEKLSEAAEKYQLFSRFEKTLKEGEEDYKKKVGWQEKDNKRNEKINKEEKIEVAQKSQRISKIKNGNLAAAKNCTEVTEALIPKGELMGIVSIDSKAVYLDPTKKLYASTGKLISYKGNRATTFDANPMTGEKYAFLKFSDKTLWFKDRLAIGSGLYFVGRYVDNDTVSMKQGMNEFDVTARTYEVLCASNM